MFSQTFLVFCLTFTTLVQSHEEEFKLDCSNSPKKPVCASNGVTYDSYCELLKLQKSSDDEKIQFECDGNCPCDPLEVVKMDQDTVGKIKKARALFQLAEHEKEELNHSEDYLSIQLVDEDEVQKHFIKEVSKNVQKKECSASEMAELPTRLIDWFHVLRINEKVQEMKDQRIEQEPVMHAEKFTEEKIRAMYSQLACTKQDDKEIEKAVCLNPVKWMFNHLDGNNDDVLSALELSEIEDIQNEQCIKPFLQSCDQNGDGKVELSEFCKCLCVTPPCTRLIKDVPVLMLRGVPTPMPGFFVPRCDDDGFFMPEQCNPRKECWCVDRNGGELLNTRTDKGSASCGAYNTANPNKRLIPLDVRKENGVKNKKDKSTN